MYTPQVTKKPIIFANNMKFANHFPIHTMVNGTQKLQRIAQNPLNSSTPVLNHTKFMQSTLISQDSLSPLAKLPKFMTFTHSCNLTDFAQFTLAGKQPRLQQIQQNPP